MARLLEVGADDVQADRVAAARRAADGLQCTVVLKGAGTLIVEPGRRLFTINTTGNPGMASGGTGDVLSGIIVGLLARRLSPLSPYDAARVGAYLHGLAGDLAAAELGQEGMIAGDLLRRVPAAVRRVHEGAR
jgi:hydroxyethylthiazole kinase-like uncharacterized protein yjeF